MVGIRSLSTNAERRTSVMGIPITAKIIQNILPLLLNGVTCPYPETKE